MQLFFCRFIYKSNFIKRPVPESCFGQNCLFLYIRVIPVSGIQTIVPVIPHYKITIFRNFIRSEASCHLFRAEAYRLCLLFSINVNLPVFHGNRLSWQSDHALDKNLGRIIWIFEDYNVISLWIIFDICQTVSRTGSKLSF